MSGEGGERLIERKAIIRLILHFFGGERLWKLELCDLPTTDRSPFSEINKPKIDNSGYFFKLKQSIKGRGRKKAGREGAETGH